MLSPPRAAYLLRSVIFWSFSPFYFPRMSSPSNDVDNTSESATHGTAQGSCTTSSPRRNSVLTAERATYSGSIDSSASTNLHDTTRVSYRETPDSSGFGDVDTTLPREEIRVANGALRAANTAASPVSIPQTANSGDSQAQISQETHSGPPVGQVQTSTLDGEMVDSERTLPLTTNHSATNSQEFPEWKANGRPRCQKCLKSHFGAVCNMTKWEVNLKRSRGICALSEKNGQAGKQAQCSSKSCGKATQPAASTTASTHRNTQ